MSQLVSHRQDRLNPQSQQLNNFDFPHKKSPLFQNPSEYAPEILSNLGEGKAETGVRREFRKGWCFPDKLRNKFLGSIHWGSFFTILLWRSKEVLKYKLDPRFREDDTPKPKNNPRFYTGIKELSARG